MLYQAADTMLKGEDVTMQASMLKLKTGRIAREITGTYLNVRNNELSSYSITDLIIKFFSNCRLLSPILG